MGAPPRPRADPPLVRVGVRRPQRARSKIIFVEEAAGRRARPGRSPGIHGDSHRALDPAGDEQLGPPPLRPVLRTPRPAPTTTSARAGSGSSSSCASRSPAIPGEDCAGRTTSPPTSALAGRRGGRGDRRRGTGSARRLPARRRRSPTSATACSSQWRSPAPPPFYYAGPPTATTLRRAGRRAWRAGKASGSKLAGWAMQLEIWSDIACPWCYVGKRRFEAALAAFEHRDEVTVTWRSFELDPGAPRRARRRPRRAPREQSTGSSVEQAPRDAGPDRPTTAAGEGLDFHFETCDAAATRSTHTGSCTSPRCTGGRTRCRSV